MIDLPFSTFRKSSEGKDENTTNVLSPLLADVVAFPRKVLTNSFFFQGLKVPEDDLIEAMDIAGDALCSELRTRGVKDRAKRELALLSKIEKAPMEARERCKLVCRILNGDSIEVVDEMLNKKETT